MTYYFVNRHTSKRYRVLKLDRSQNRIIMQGEIQKFSVPYDLDLLDRCGYDLVEG